MRPRLGWRGLPRRLPPLTPYGRAQKPSHRARLPVSESAAGRLQGRLHGSHQGRRFEVTRNSPSSGQLQGPPCPDTSGFHGTVLPVSRLTGSLRAPEGWGRGAPPSRCAVGANRRVAAFLCHRPHNRPLALGLTWSLMGYKSLRLYMHAAFTPKVKPSAQERGTSVFSEVVVTRPSPRVRHDAQPFPLAELRNGHHNPTKQIF